MSSELPSPAFAPTRWTLVLRARGEAPEARAALNELCEAYYQPVFRFLCRQGQADDAARELTQEFFARLLARGGVRAADPAGGRFRSYLLGAVKHFLSDQRDHARRQKRGGGEIPQSLDAPALGEESGTPVEQEFADPSAVVSDSFFDRQWALAVMDRALTALASEFSSEGKSNQFETLKPWLVGEAEQLSQTAAAARLGLSESALKVAVHRLRKRFRETVREEIAHTVGQSGEVDVELRYLVEVLAAG